MNAKKIDPLINANCSCQLVECPRHGKCMECVEFHKRFPKGHVPNCMTFLVENHIEERMGKKRP